MNKIVWIIVVVLLLLVLGFYFMPVGRVNDLPAIDNVVQQGDVSADNLVDTNSLVEVFETSNMANDIVASENTIIYSDDGYSPKEIAIGAGETVRFVNQSSIPFWPASAMHPTHAVYPTTGGCIGSTFDACNPLPPGESFSFSFTEVGTWKYHDHLTVSNTGTVVVK